MTSEEKAKAYDEALERARKKYNSKYHPSEGPSGVYLNNADLEEIFPALKESKDERIMEALLEYFGKQCDMSDVNGFYAYEIYGWLKKQKEQKSEVKYVYPKFRKGDIIEPITPNGSFTPVRVRSINDGSYICRSDDDRAFMSLPLQREDEYKIVEPKPAEWSEEDEVMLKEIISFFKDGSVKLQHDLDLCAGFLEKKLKSLCPQYRWKPSKKQMSALNYAYCELFKRKNVGHNILGPLQELCDELHKLM